MDHASCRPAARRRRGCSIGICSNSEAETAYLATRGGCWFVRAGQDYPSRRCCFPAGQEGSRHPPFKAVGAGAASLAAAGCVITEDEPLAGYDRVYVYDPFGNRIELMQRLDTH